MDYLDTVAVFLILNSRPTMGRRENHSRSKEGESELKTSIAEPWSSGGCLYLMACAAYLDLVVLTSYIGGA